MDSIFYESFDRLQQVVQILLVLVFCYQNCSDPLWDVLAFENSFWNSRPLFEVPIYQETGQNGLNWQCCLAGSSKTTPRILIFFNCHGCQTFISYKIHCYLSPPKSWHNNTFQTHFFHEFSIPNLIFQNWHKRCFACSTCNRHLDSTTVNDGPDGDIYCRTCYAAKFGMKGYGFGQGAGTLVSVWLLIF